jgi:hypothetical protein
VKLTFARDLEVEFTDRGVAIRQIYELGEKGTRYPVVVYGPEGCGKTAWLKQATLTLREIGYDALYINPLYRDFVVKVDISEIAQRLLNVISEASGVATLKLANMAILLARELMTRWKRRKIALLVDDVFQAIGLGRAELYVKELLGLIEYPPGSYDSMVVIVATSKSVTRGRIGRHRWAWLRAMWNMSESGFLELYNKIPGAKPPFKDVWRVTGGNPDVLSQLYQHEWDVDKVVESLVEHRKLRLFIRSLSDIEKAWLNEALEDPDTLFARERLSLLQRLVELNLVVDDLPARESFLWIDTPPEADLEIGVGKYVAWQTPVHREAVRRTLLELKS